jgi:hypothetical protein
MVDQSAIEEFKASLRGTLLQPADPDYDDARKVWNGMIDKRPALIARCAGVADIMQCVHFARAEPGLTWREFDRETQAFGLATTGGQISATGIAGLTLGGGWGYLARRYGLSCDNLQSVDVVTANGQLLTASAAENADLFFGVRGGGGNFGVVTSFEYRLHPVSTVLSGIVAYPFQKAKDVLKLFRELTSAAPDELASGVVLISLPDGTPVAGVVLCYTGPLAEGECLLKPLRTFGPPLIDQIGPIPYTAAQQLIDGFYPSGLQNYWKSSFLQTVSDTTLDTMVDFCSRRPSPMCHGLIEHQLGGAVSRADREATAFVHRDVEYSFMALGVCATPLEVGKCSQWVRDFWGAMQPASTGGVYVNYLGREADEGPERIKAAYGPEKYARLVALKNRYDPSNLFRFNQNIEPGQASPFATGHLA